MDRRAARLLFGTISVATAACAGIAAAHAPGQDAAASARAAYATLPLMFEARGDDRDAPVALVSHGHAPRIAVTRDAIHVALPGTRLPGAGEIRAAAAAADTVTLRFLGAAPAARLRGRDPQPTRIHYLRDGSPADNRIDVPVFGRASIERLYPHIDVIVYGSGDALEYDLVVAPHGDPAAMRMQIEGASGVALDRGGDAVITTPQGDLRLHRPVAWQEGNGGRTDVDAAFVLSRPMEIAFEVGEYDHARPLVIDPVIAYATYVGGSSADGALAIAVDANGSAYAAGYTTSADFPLRNSLDASLGRKSDMDAFVAKLAPDGKSLVYATYLGGSTGREMATAIAVDAMGSAYVAGTTSAGDFPVTANAYQKGTAAGGSFVAKLSPAGNALVYSTYVAATTAHSLAVDGAGSAYLTGKATPAFVATPGAFEVTSPVAFGETGFVLKLDPAGSSASYATFLGGPGTTQANAIAVDGDGRAFVGGLATVDFPIVLPFQLFPGGDLDGFVSVLDPSGSRLVTSTLIGGSRDDAVNALALGADGSVYIAGETYSANFPSVNGFQPVKSGFRLINSTVGNAFVAKVDLQTRRIVWSSFLGGEICTYYCQTLYDNVQYPGDAAYAIAVDADGHAYVTGLARTLTFPLVDSTSARNQGSQDSGFVAKVSAAGTALIFSTFVRVGMSTSGSIGRFPDGAINAVAVDGAGAAYVAGESTDATDFTPSSGALQTTNPGIPTPIAVKFPPPSGRLTLGSSNVDTDADTPVTLTASVEGAQVTGYVAFYSGTRALGSATLDANRATFATLMPPGIHTLNARVATPDGTLDTSPLIQIVDQPLVCTR